MRLSILLIEHDTDLAARIGRGLRNAGYLVMALHDADEAIDLLRQVAFELVLADVGTLRYSAAGTTGLAVLLRVLRGAPLLRFTTPLTMGQDSSSGAVVLDHPPRDLPALLAAIERLFATPVPVAV